MNIFILCQVRKSNQDFKGFNAKSGKVNRREQNMEKKNFNASPENEASTEDNTEGGIPTIATIAKIMKNEGIAKNEQGDKQRREAESHLTRMLLLVSTSFLVFTTPNFTR